MACDRAMRQVSLSGRVAGVSVSAGRMAFVGGVALARAVRAGWRAERLVDKKLLDSPIPTTMGLLAMAGGGGGSLSLSALRAVARVQRVRMVHRRRLLAKAKAQREFRDLSQLPTKSPCVKLAK